MNKYVNLLSLIFLIFVVLWIYKTWLFSPIISAGDSWYYFPSMFDNHYLKPFSWYTQVLSTGLGGQGFAYVNTYMTVALILEFTKLFNSTWETFTRIFVYLAFVGLSISSSVFLIRKIFPQIRFWIFAPIIFTFNTYVLMLVGGGQIITALSYSLIPFSIFLFIKLLEVKTDGKNISPGVLYLISATLVFSLQCILDLRIAFVTAVAVAVYLLVLLLTRQLKLANFIMLIFVFLLTALLSSYWLIPIILYGIDPIQQLGSDYSSSEIVKFLSFAKLENTIGLLHPNFPENIFGKIGFMKPEFLLLPVIAFSSLIFIGKEKRETKFVLFFALIGLTGIFLGKGASEPFGDSYIWLFENVPGFQLFRDSFKWYALIALSYSMLIPFTVWKIYELLDSHSKFSVFPTSPKLRGTGNFQFSNRSKFFNLQNVFLVFVFAYLLFLIRPAIFGQLGGTFIARDVPIEYKELEKYLSRDKSFYRTLWLPNTMLFGYYTNQNPQMSGRDLFREFDHTKLIKKVNTEETREFLRNAGVKYVIIPSDTEKEIFLTERKYDEKKYLSFVNSIDNIPWLKKEKEIGKIVVYKTLDFKDHFWCDCDTIINYKYLNPVQYELSVQDAKTGDRIIFSETYDEHWIAESSEFRAQSSKFENRFNSFIIPKDGDFSFKVYYSLQKYVDFGVKISLITLTGLALVLTVILVKKLRK